MNHLITGRCCSFIYLTLTVSNGPHSCLEKQRPCARGPSVFLQRGGGGEVTLARTRWPRKHSRGSDVEIKAGRRTAPTLHSVSPHLFVPLIQACSIPLPLVASAFSKGRGIRSASIPPLCLILFCPFVVA